MVRHYIALHTYRLYIRLFEMYVTNSRWTIDNWVICFWLGIHQRNISSTRILVYWNPVVRTGGKGLGFRGLLCHKILCLCAISIFFGPVHLGLCPGYNWAPC